MGKPKAPAPPDPYKTAGAQTATNIGTAIANNTMGNVNQITPDGSLTYSQTGTTKWTDPNNGKVYDLPQITATQELSENGKALKAKSDETKLGLATLANDQTARLQGHLSEPVDLSREALDGYISDNFQDDFDQQWGQREADLETRLSQQGIRRGSAAYDRAMAEYNTARGGAHDNFLGNMYSMAKQTKLAERNAPINEVSALMSGSQVAQPQFTNAQGATMPTTDVAGLINRNYDQRLGAWQRNQSMRNGMLGGLFSLGARGISGGLIG